jgi:uncharacterized OB-fold protein
MTTETVVARPVPVADEESAAFFEGMARGVLMLQRCRACGAWHFPVRELCAECLSTDLEWAESSGRGTVHTFGVMHRVYHPAFASEVPYNLAVVEFGEGPRMSAAVTGVAHEAIRVGMPVEVTFEEVAPGLLLPKFRPAL